MCHRKKNGAIPSQSVQEMKSCVSGKKHFFHKLAGRHQKKLKPDRELMLLFL
jgi:hypothetical protein